jgi:thioredoxin 1
MIVMNNVVKIVIIVALVGAVITVFAIKRNNPSSDDISSLEPIQISGKELPVLVDLGADKCIPCKKMAPILEELKNEYEGRLIVDFIDVWKNPDEAPKYGVKLIPTQIFFNASGKELFRHQGFYSKENILSKWAELGVELTKPK